MDWCTLSGEHFGSDQNKSHDSEMLHLGIYPKVLTRCPETSPELIARVLAMMPVFIGFVTNGEGSRI